MRPVKMRSDLRDYRASNSKSRSEPISFSIPSQETRFRQTETLSSFTQIHCRIPWKLGYHSLFGIQTTEPVAQDVINQLSPFQSTAEALEKLLTSASVSEIEKYNNRIGPGSMIFRIVHQDTVGLLQLMHSAVAEIDLASGDVELQETALHWRRRLDEFRALLLGLDASLHSFVAFLHPHDSRPSKDSPLNIDANPIEYLLYDVIGEINVQNSRITQAYSSLTSKTQISDSHRSIAEAETVTRLTELASLFIPLSFATSIFGMQFIDDSTPATTYIAVVLALTSGAYLLRFVVDETTEQRSDLRLSIRDNVTAYARLRVGSRISTATFLQWLLYVMRGYLRKFWKMSFLAATVSIMVVIPLPIIWTSSLYTGLKVVLSFILLCVPIFLVAVYFCTKWLRRQRRPRVRGGSHP